MEKFNSHMKAADSGCPICKRKLDSLRAEYSEVCWRNRCTDECKGVLEYTVNYETASVPSKASKKVTKEDLQQSPPVCTGWTFVANMYEWMTVDGKIVPIKRLPDKELVDSIWSLVHASFSKIGSTLAWIKQLPSFGVPYAYPKEELRPGKDYAKEKLEEFYENVEARGWLKTGSE